jgi:hypothetical protein
MSLIGVQLQKMHMYQSSSEVQDKAVTVRPSSTALFCISSEDRYANYAERRIADKSPFSFRISKNESLLNGFFKRIALTEFRMLWTLPNIATAWGNNKIIINVGGTDYIQTLPDAFYTPTDFVQVFQALVRANTGGLLPNFTATLQDDGKIVFASNTVTTFGIFPLTVPAVSLTYATSRQLYDMLNLPTTFPLAVSWTSGIVNLRATDYIDIVCSQLTYNQDLKDGTSAPIVRDMMARIYLDDSSPSNQLVSSTTFNTVPAVTGTIVPGYNYGNQINGSTPFTLYRQYSQAKQIKWNDTQPIGNLKFELFDDQERSIADLWAASGSPSNEWYVNPFTWNFSMLVSEN